MDPTKTPLTEAMLAKVGQPGSTARFAEFARDLELKLAAKNRTVSLMVSVKNNMAEFTINYLDGASGKRYFNILSNGEAVLIDLSPDEADRLERFFDHRDQEDADTAARLDDGKYDEEVPPR